MNYIACQAPSVHGIFLAKNTGCYFLLQGILLDQGLNPHLLHWQADSLLLSLHDTIIRPLGHSRSRVQDKQGNVCVIMLVIQSCPTLCDPMDCTVRQALLSMGFPRQGYWSGLPFPSPSKGIGNCDI